MTSKLKVIMYGIKVKLKKGEDLETILASYTKLTEEEEDFIRKNI